MFTDNHDELYNKGLTKRDLGQYEEAIDDLNQAIQLDPNNVFCYNMRGHLKYQYSDGPEQNQLRQRRKPNGV